MIDDMEEGADCFDADIDSAFDEYRKTGNGIVLFETMRRCYQYGKPIPVDVWGAFLSSIEKYHTGAARTLDEAFGVSRPKNWSQPAAQSRSRKTMAGVSIAGSVYLAVVHRHLNDSRAIDNELFEEVGALHAVSASTARNMYREVKALIESEQGQNF
ncbi:MAG: hypothetical protein AB1482_11980 [Pseudomonadota bacterium]